MLLVLIIINITLDRKKKKIIKEQKKKVGIEMKEVINEIIIKIYVYK